jgi:MYXO-CTERM domain-containing protein
VGGVPSAWGSIASEKACLPDGIVMAAQGHAAVNGEFGGSSSSSGGGTPTLSAGDAGVATNTGPSPVIPVPPGTNEGAGNAAKDTVTHSSGCAYGGSDASSLWLALAMIGLVARLARRRREDR